MLGETDAETLDALFFRAFPCSLQLPGSFLNLATLRCAFVGFRQLRPQRWVRAPRHSCSMPCGRKDGLAFPQGPHHPTPAYKPAVCCVCAAPRDVRKIFTPKVMLSSIGMCASNCRHAVLGSRSGCEMNEPSPATQDRTCLCAEVCCCPGLAVSGNRFGIPTFGFGCCLARSQRCEGDPSWFAEVYGSDALRQREHGL